MYSLLWSEHCAYKHSKKLLRTLPTEGQHVVMGPGENAGAVDVGGGLVVRVQGRVAQPPERGRAVPGRGDRRRRHPARHLRDRRAADRGARLAALRRAGRRVGARARATCSTAPSPGSATTATRSACRRSAARSTSRARTSTTAWSTRWRSGWPSASGWCAAPRPARATCSCCSARRPAATGSAARRCSPRPSSSGDTSAAATRTSARPCRSAIRSRRRSCSSARSSCSQRDLLVSLQDLGAAGLTSVGRRDGLQGRGRDRDRRRRACRCASPTWSRSR